MLTWITLLGSEPEAHQVISIPWQSVMTVAVYLIGFWITLFLDGLIDGDGSTNDGWGWVLALIWPITLAFFVMMGLGILLKYLFMKIPRNIKSFLFYCSLPFRPRTVGELLAKKFKKKEFEKKPLRYIATEKYAATFGEDGRITSLRRN